MAEEVRTLGLRLAAIYNGAHGGLNGVMPGCAIWVKPDDMEALSSFMAKADKEQG